MGPWWRRVSSTKVQSQDIFTLGRVLSPTVFASSTKLEAESPRSLLYAFGKGWVHANFLYPYSMRADACQQELSFSCLISGTLDRRMFTSAAPTISHNSRRLSEIQRFWLGRKELRKTTTMVPMRIVARMSWLRLSP